MILPTRTEKELSMEDENIKLKTGGDGRTTAVPRVDPVDDDRKQPKGRAGSRTVKLVLLLVVLAVAGTGGKHLWTYLDSYESTDDAQIEGHLNGIGSRIGGTVTSVHFENNQVVTAGHVFGEPEPRDYIPAGKQDKTRVA